MVMKQPTEKWPGGYIRKGLKRPTYVIERWVDGVHYKVSTRCSNLRAAMKHLERFEENPDGYRAGGHVGARPGVFLSDEMIAGWASYQLNVKRSTRHYVKTCLGYLRHWRIHLEGVDIRAMDARLHIKDFLAANPRGHKWYVVSLKSLFAYLRKELDLIKTHEDATLSIQMPAVRPEKQVRRKAVSWERFVSAMRLLPSKYRDPLILLSGTGWHYTELCRFASEGHIAPGNGTVAAVLVTVHKSGDLTRTPIVDANHLTAAQNILAAGHVIEDKAINKHLAKACRDAGVEPFTVGVMRHSVATWAVERGATPATVAEFLGHRSSVTTKRFYVDISVPTTTVPLPSLH